MASVAFDLLAGRATVARLTADSAVMTLIPYAADDDYIRLWPDIGPDDAVSPFLTYSLGGVPQVATPINQPPAMVTIPVDVTAWKQYLAKEPLDDLVVAVQEALTGSDLRGVSQIVEGYRISWYYGGSIPVRGEAGDSGQFTRSATRFLVEIGRLG